MGLQLFDIFVVFSFLVILLIISRLFAAVRTTNERIEILSKLLTDARSSIRRLRDAQGKTAELIYEHIQADQPEWLKDFEIEVDSSPDLRQLDELAKELEHTLGVIKKNDRV